MNETRILGNILLDAADILIRRGRNVFLKALAIPMSCLVILDTLQDFELIEGGLMLIAINLAAMILNVLIAVTTHRLVLFGPGSVSEWGHWSWSRRETEFLLAAIAVPAVIALPLIVVYMFVGESFWIGLFVLVSLTAWAFGRLSLIFPSIAVDQSLSWRRAWALSAPRQTLLTLVVVLPALILVPMGALYLVPQLRLVANIGGVLVFVYGVAILSLAYREIVQPELSY